MSRFRWEKDPTYTIDNVARAWDSQTSRGGRGLSSTHRLLQRGFRIRDLHHDRFDWRGLYFPEASRPFSATPELSVINNGRTGGLCDLRLQGFPSLLPVFILSLENGSRRLHAPIPFARIMKR